MRVRNVNRRAGEEIQLQMTPMIDVVFQLLVFFILSFKIVAPEGDFNVKMPPDDPSLEWHGTGFLPPITVRLVAGSDGELSEILFGTRPLGRDFCALRQAMLDLMGDDPDPTLLATTEVVFDCDHNLRYENVIEAITAVSGYVVQEGPGRGQVVRVIEKIKFAPPRRGPE